jgi:hypothetical protein
MAEGDSKDTSGARLQITLAIITLTGVLGTAFFANIDKIFPPKKDTAAQSNSPAPDNKLAASAAPPPSDAVASSPGPGQLEASQTETRRKGARQKEARQKEARLAEKAQTETQQTQTQQAGTGPAGAEPAAVNDLRRIRVTNADARWAMFDVGYSYSSKDPAPISIVIKVYSTPSPSDGEAHGGKPDRKLLGQGETSVTGPPKGTVGVRVERLLDAPMEIGFVEVQLTGGDGPILVKQVPIKRIWNP